MDKKENKDIEFVKNDECQELTEKEVEEVVGGKVEYPDQRDVN